MNINPPNSVIAATKEGLLEDCLDFRKILILGMIKADAITIMAASAEVIFKNSSMISGKL